MESRSSESNYGFGRYSGGYSSESSYSSESRDSFSSSAEVPKRKFNSLEDIDKLIERLESSVDQTKITSKQANQVLEQRNYKIKELKNLVELAKRAEAEKRIIRQLQQENDELDAAMKSITSGFHK